MRFELWLNALPHTWHLCGFSPTIVQITQLSRKFIFHHIQLHLNNPIILEKWKKKENLQCSQFDIFVEFYQNQNGGHAHVNKQENLRRIHFTSFSRDFSTNEPYLNGECCHPQFESNRFESIYSPCERTFNSDAILSKGFPFSRFFHLFDEVTLFLFFYFFFWILS